jgi:hypothetical protein
MSAHVHPGEEAGLPHSVDFDLAPQHLKRLVDHVVEKSNGARHLAIRFVEMEWPPDVWTIHFRPANEHSLRIVPSGHYNVAGVVELLQRVAGGIEQRLAGQQ